MLHDDSCAVGTVIDKRGSFGRLRVVYFGRQELEPSDFVARLGRAFERAGIDASLEHTSSDDVIPHHQPRGWPSDVPGPRMGEMTVLVEPYHPTWCGTGAAASAMASMVTLGILPAFDFDTIVWRLTAYVGDGRAMGPVEISIEQNSYFWPPLLPLVPANRVWRWIDGDRFDHALRVFPAYLKQAVHEAERQQIAASGGPEPR